MEKSPHFKACRKILLVFTMLVVSISMQAQYSLLVYDHSWDKASFEQQIKDMNGAMKVTWPGHAIVSWKNGTPSNLSEGIKIRTFNEGLKRSLMGMDQEGDQALECSTNEWEAQAIQRSKGTSDTLKGHTVCAMFFVNQTGSNHEWSISDQNQCLENAAINLLWWSDQASRYGIEATFEIKPYLFDNPVCQINVDPTIASQTIWGGQIMQALGYENSGNNLQQQTAFISDLIEEMESDWAFIGFIIRGSSTYRSNAYLFGPSTTCTFAATRAGLTFAHEVGHIFGLRDEYEERAGITHGFEINGLANLNADFRNIVNAPCIMKSLSGPPLCSYNAFHLHWTDQQSFFEIFTDPQDALFRVEYLNPTSDQPVLSRIYQGRTLLPMGLGAKFRLSGLEEISTFNGDYFLPQWQNSGTQSVIVTVEEEGSIGSTLTYLPSDERKSPMTLLTQGLHYSGRRINEIDFANDALLVLTNQGISVYKNGVYRLFDKTNEVRPGEFITTFRTGASFQKLDNNRWLIGAQSGLSLPEIVLIDHDEELSSWSPPGTFREQGIYAALTMTLQGDIIAAFDGGGLHRYHSNGTFEVLRLEGSLPDAPVSAMHLLPDGSILLGYDGGRTGMEAAGLYLLDPVTMAVERPLGIPEAYLNEPIRKIKFIQEAMLLVSRDKIIVSENGEFTVIIPQAAQVFDADRISSNRWVMATSGGIEYQDQDGQWTLMNSGSHNLPDQIVRTVKATPSGTIIAGYANYGVSVHLIDEPTVSSKDQSERSHPIVFYPNPLTGSELSIQTASDLSNFQIELLDLNGKVIFSERANNYNGDTWTITVPGLLTSGIYIIHLTEGTNRKAGLIQILR